MKPDENEKKLIDIVVNGRPFEVEHGKISFNEVVALVFDIGSDPQTRYAVTYERGSENAPDGVLLAGKSVQVKDGMIFNVSATGQS